MAGAWDVLLWQLQQPLLMPAPECGLSLSLAPFDHADPHYDTHFLLRLVSLLHVFIAFSSFFFPFCVNPPPLPTLFPSPHLTFSFPSSCSILPHFISMLSLPIISPSRFQSPLSAFLFLLHFNLLSLLLLFIHITT